MTKGIYIDPFMSEKTKHEYVMTLGAAYGKYFSVEHATRHHIYRFTDGTGEAVFTAFGASEALAYIHGRNYVHDRVMR